MNTSITWDELNLLVGRSEPEGPTLEFKGALADDKWATGKTLSAKARDSLAKELIGFANTSGGRLILGVTDIDDRAGSIAAVPHVEELASRLEQCLIDVIDPPHFGIRIRAISEPGRPSGGVIVIDVPASSVRPHRLATKNEVYVRNGKETKPLRQMRQIHDMVIAARNQHIEVQKRLGSRLNEKQPWAHQRGTPYVRISALPVVPVSLPDLSLEAGSLLISPRRAISYRIDGGQQELNRSWAEPIKVGSIRPVLGGVQRGSFSRERHGEEILREHYQSDGLVEVEYVGGTPNETFGLDPLDPEELIFQVYYVLRSAQELYGRQAQEVILGGQLIVPKAYRGRGFRSGPEQFSLPESRLSLVGDLGPGVLRVLNDLRNAGGQKSVSSFEVIDGL